MGSIGGFSGGLDVNGIVSQILNAERLPARRLEQQRSVLQSTDSAFGDLASKLSELGAKLAALSSDSFGAKTATSSNTSVFTATATSAATAGLYTVKVTALAKAGTYASNVFAGTSATTALNLSGSFDITLSGATKTITVAATDSLSSIQSQINNQGLDLTAAVITDATGVRLSVISNKTGSANDVTLANNTVSGLTFTKTVTGSDATLKVNEIDITSASNTVTNVLPGVTLNLLATHAETHNLTITSDQTAVKKSLNDFVSAYNALAKFAKQQFTFDKAKNSSGILGSDPTLRQIAEDLQSKLTDKYTGNTTYQTLASVGIGFQQDGTLAIDDAKLTAALNANPTEVQNLFTATGSVGKNVSVSLDAANNATNGFVTVARNSISSLITDVNKRISDIDQRLAFRQEGLIAQFSRADAALRNLASMQSQLSAQLRGL